MVKQARGRHQPRRAHPGLLGRPADRRRRAEHRRQGRLRAGLPRRQPGRGAGQRVGRGGPQHRRRACPRRRASRPTSPGRRPLAADQNNAGDRSMQDDRGVTFVVIIVMLLLVYRSIVTVLLALVMVVLEMAAARGIVAFLGYHNLSGSRPSRPTCWSRWRSRPRTDYAIFLIGRYQEARAAGEDREAGLLHHVSRHRARRAGLGADHRRRDVLPALHPAALLPDAGHPVGDRHGGRGAGRADAGPRGHLGGQPIRHGARTQAGRSQCRGWRRIGAAVVRWPGPILVAAIAVALVGLLALPGYQHQLQRPQLHARRPARQRGLRRRRPALLRRRG